MAPISGMSCYFIRWRCSKKDGIALDWLREVITKKDDDDLTMKAKNKILGDDWMDDEWLYDMVHKRW